MFGDFHIYDFHWICASQKSLKYFHLIQCQSQCVTHHLCCHFYFLMYHLDLSFVQRKIMSIIITLWSRNIFFIITDNNLFTKLNKRHCYFIYILLCYHNVLKLLLTIFFLYVLRELVLHFIKYYLFWFDFILWWLFVSTQKLTIWLMLLKVWSQTLNLNFDTDENGSRMSSSFSNLTSWLICMKYVFECFYTWN